MKVIKHGETNKVLMVEEETLFSQGDDGEHGSRRNPNEWRWHLPRQRPRGVRFWKGSTNCNHNARREAARQCSGKRNLHKRVKPRLAYRHACYLLEDVLFGT